MANSLNFQTRKKKTFELTLEDGTILKVSIPKKELMTDISATYKVLRSDISDEKVVDELYELCAKIVNNNVSELKITKKELEEQWNYNDVLVFYQCFMEFISEVEDSKN